ncbi:hypothetical protein T06_10229 [Trichinella sp. T6]|nr:hypothetical protein T06_10229 [Trichinella sp. T6]
MTGVHNGNSVYYTVEWYGARIPIYVVEMWCAGVVGGRYSTLIRQWKYGEQEEMEAVANTYITENECLISRVGDTTINVLWDE